MLVFACPFLIYTLSQLALTGADDPRLEAFVKQYRQGPQTPEPGAACTGGSDGELPPTSG